MRVYRGIGELPKFDRAVVTIGSFDGVHSGHRAIINRLLSIAKQSKGQSVVLTFEPHPRIVLGHGDGLRLLTTLEEKTTILEELGVENLVVIPFDREFSRLSYTEFVSSYLVDALNVETLVVGYDHHIGRNNEGRYDALLKLSVEHGFNISKVEKFSIGDHDNLSSTVIRTMVARGEMSRAEEALSHPYIIIGQSDSDGRVWISTPLKLIPPTGEYSVEINSEPTILHINENGVMNSEIENSQIMIRFL